MSLVRYILSIPTIGAGAENLFNSARDSCHYRRGSLNATTIQDLMMYMCISWFEGEEEQLALGRELFMKNEREALKEPQSQEDLYPISDSEEVDVVICKEQPTTQDTATQAIPQSALGKK